MLDYFKHVSPRSLRAMGLALINRSGSSEILLLYSICVNSAAFKFINTILSGSDSGGVEDGMRLSAATYLSSVKLAMARIQLLSTPSLVFLQALLCSVSSILEGTTCADVLNRPSLRRVRGIPDLAGLSFPRHVKYARILTYALGSKLVAPKQKMMKRPSIATYGVTYWTRKTP